MPASAVSNPPPSDAGAITPHRTMARIRPADTMSCMRVLLQEKGRPVGRDAGNKALRRSGASLGDAGIGAAGESSQKTAAVRSDVTVNPGPPGPCRALQGGGSDAIKAR